VTVDLSNLDYIGSSGLAALFSVQKSCLQKGGSMTITGLGDIVEELFKLTRLEMVFNVRA
jgi:anti-sigma B factor antagonist